MQLISPDRLRRQQYMHIRQSLDDALQPHFGTNSLAV